MTGKIELKVPDQFSFKSTVFSHGWADLPPFSIIQEPLKLFYTLQTGNKKVYDLEISFSSEQKLIIQTAPEAGAKDRDLILQAVKRLFRLDEDFTRFYAMAGVDREFSWIVDYRAGRMLRCATLWEDMVKMLCTTNCTWRLTQIMTENLVKKLGTASTLKKTAAVKKAFPRAETIAAKDEAYLRSEIKMGYRAPYLFEFACKIANRKLDLKTFEDKQIPTAELYKMLRGIKGFGNYAVSNLLKLLGRYDYLGADSWSRQKFAEKHNKEKNCDDKIIEAFYKKFGSWSGLFFWLDVSEEWYRREKPW